MWYLFWACQSEAPPKKQMVVEEKVVEEEEEEEEEEEKENKAPLFTKLQWKKAKAKTSDELRVIAKGKDPEGERPRIRYQWFVNGKKLPSKTQRYLKPTQFKKKDNVLVKVMLSDGENEITKELSLTIENTPPQWVSDPRNVKKIDGFQVQASDVDKDKILYKIQGAPKGMTIDSNRGVLSYKGAQDEPGGVYKVAVIAEDSDGDSIRWSFQINVSPGSAVKKAKGTKPATKK